MVSSYRYNITWLEYMIITFLQTCITSNNCLFIAWLSALQGMFLQKLVTWRNIKICTSSNKCFNASLMTTSVSYPTVFPLENYLSCVIIKKSEKVLPVLKPAVGRPMVWQCQEQRWELGSADPDHLFLISKATEIQENVPWCFPAGFPIQLLKSANLTSAGCQDFLQRLKKVCRHKY